ncbi:MAG: hypothetical protein GEU77_18180 [Deltaproteobacteria bacterium]|nr:hypothetical protein [Deltaproteobacteria bacterium]
MTDRSQVAVSRRSLQSLLEDDSRSILHIVLLLGLCGLLYFPYLGSTPFFDKGEPREALAVQDIVQRGEWLFPLKRATDVPSKPPLFHWSAALASKIMGRLDEVTIRFPSALYATLGVLLIYVFGRKLFGSQIALLGGGILATTLVYSNQALTARVDMTLCFFVTLSLVIFYSLYRGFLTGELPYYGFYTILGIGLLAKGPLGIVLPALVIGVFLALKKRWDLVFKSLFHPSVILTLLLGVGWYAIAITRGGEGFIDRQLLQENIERFSGGSGHSHPVHYYIPYLFSQGLPWSLFLPFLLWDFFKQNLLSDDDTLFLKLWFLVMFAFFSISVGKRPVYLLPLYPALSMLMAVWFYRHVAVSAGKTVLYRLVAIIAGSMSLLLLILSFGAMWNHDPGWFFSPIEGFLKPKDRANLILVKDSLATFGWSFTIVSLLSSALWFSLSQCLWIARLRSGVQRLILISILAAFVSRTMVMPVIAEAKSYRSFMEEVNQRVKPGDKLYLYGEFNSDSVVFYHGGAIETLDQSPEAIAGKIGPGNNYIIMAKRSWSKIQGDDRTLPAPVLSSTSTGPEGDAPLVVIQTGG